MKPRFIVCSFLAVLALVLLSACGSDDGSGGGAGAIRTQKGLAVGALAQSLGNRESGTGAGSSQTSFVGGSAPAGVPARADTSVGNGVKGFPSQPFLQQGGNGLTVQGYGTASADADSAVAEFYFFHGGATQSPPYPQGRAESGVSGGVITPAGPKPLELQEIQPISEGDLQAVIDAIVAAGVPRGDIQFIGQSYYDKYSSSASLRVTVKNLGVLDAVVQAANNAAAGLSGISLQSTNVVYTVKDCAALEIQAMKSAVEDAGERAKIFAQALGVGVGAVTGASNYSYFGGPPCGQLFPGPYALAAGAGYSAGQPWQVQVFANISATYGIQ